MPDEQEPADAEKGGEPEGCQTDHERKRAGDSRREVRHGGELSVETGFDGPDPTGEHAQDPEERAYCEHEDYEEERSVHTQSYGAEVHTGTFQAPREEGDGGPHEERSRRQELVGGSLKISHVWGETVQQRQLREDAFGCKREAFGAQDGDPEDRYGEEHQQRPGGQVQCEGAEEAPQDHACTVGGAFGDDGEGRARYRGAGGPADEDALKHLAELAR